MIQEDHKAAILHCLQATPGICFAILYGSAARSETFHDVDIALFVNRQSIPLQADFEFCFNLERQLRKLLPYSIDVIVINDAPLGFRYNVSRGVPLLINDQDSYTGFLEQTWDRHLDFVPVAMDYVREMI